MSGQSDILRARLVPAALVVACLWAPLGAQPMTDPPTALQVEIDPAAEGQADSALAPATRGVSTPADVPANGLTPLMLDRRPVREDLGLDDKDRALLAQVFDHSPHLGDAALGALMRRVEVLAYMTVPQLHASLDLPAYRNLLAEPQRYRARPVRLAIQVVRVRKLSEQDLSPWPRQAGQPLWWVECFDAAAPNPQARPMILLSIAEPPLPAGQDDGQGGQLYPSVPLESAAALYKIYFAPDREGSGRDYPLLVSWQLLTSEGTSAPADPKPKMKLMLIGLMVMMGFALLFYRRNMRRSREADEPMTYQSRRRRYEQDQARASAESPEQAGQTPEPDEHRGPSADRPPRTDKPDTDKPDDDNQDPTR